MIPESLNTPEFVELWSAWVDHRKELKKKLTPTAIKLQLRRLERWGIERAIAALEHSIGNGYQGIFEPPVAKANPAAPVLPNRPPVVVAREDEDLTPEQRAANMRRIREMAKNLAQIKQMEANHG